MTAFDEPTLRQLARSARRVVVTLGGDGVGLWDGEQATLPALPVTPTRRARLLRRPGGRAGRPRPGRRSAARSSPASDMARGQRRRPTDPRRDRGSARRQAGAGDAADLAVTPLPSWLVLALLALGAAGHGVGAAGDARRELPRPPSTATLHSLPGRATANWRCWRRWSA